MRCDKSVDNVSWTSDVVVLDPSTYHAFDCRTVAEIRNKVAKHSGRKTVSRLLHARNDKEAIAAWKSELNRVLVVFNVRSVCSCLVVANRPPLQTELIMNTHTIVADMHQNMQKTRGDADYPDQLVSDTYSPQSPDKC